MSETRISILKWEEGLVPMGLMQLESLTGNSNNPDSYTFPVKFVQVPGACTETVIINPSQEVLKSMIEIGKNLEKEGIKAIATSCGFNAIFQQELANALSIPVFSSALLQVPFVQNLVGTKNGVAVITANKASLTKDHLQACGITDDMNVYVYGLEDASEWGKIFDKPEEAIDMEIVEHEIIDTAKKALSEHANIKAIVLECTDLPPFAQKIREVTGLPVFDFNTMANYVALGIGNISLYKQGVV